MKPGTIVYHRGWSDPMIVIGHYFTFWDQIWRNPVLVKVVQGAGFDSSDLAVAIKRGNEWFPEIVRTNRVVTVEQNIALMESNAALERTAATRALATAKMWDDRLKAFKKQLDSNLAL